MEKNISILTAQGIKVINIPIKKKYYNEAGVLLMLHHYYINELQKSWTVSEYYSGYNLIGRQHKTMKEAEAEAEIVLKKNNITNQKAMEDYLKNNNIEIINI